MVTKLAAMLLLDEKGRTGKVLPWMQREDLRPEAFVEQVLLRSAERIGDDINGDPRYRAVLVVSVTRDDLAAAFHVGEELGGARSAGGKPSPPDK
jgi:hypothetical protein